MQFDCYRQYLNATNQSKVIQYAVTSALFFHIGICYVFTVMLEYGVVGVSVATIITQAVYTTFVMIWTWKMTAHPISPIPSDVTSLLNKDDLKVYLGISGPSIVMLCAEWWSYAILTLMATFISVGAVSSMAISYNYQQLIF